jgi:hypothetical protein
MGRYDEAKILFEKVVEKDVVKANHYLYDIYFWNIDFRMQTWQLRHI